MPVPPDCSFLIPFAALKNTVYNRANRSFLPVADVYIYIHTSATVRIVMYFRRHVRRTYQGTHIAFRLNPSHITSKFRPSPCLLPSHLNISYGVTATGQTSTKHLSRQAYWESKWTAPLIPSVCCFYFILWRPHYVHFKGGIHGVTQWLHLKLKYPLYEGKLPNNEPFWQCVPSTAMS
jgi:hypothetical protein